MTAASVSGMLFIRGVMDTETVRVERRNSELLNSTLASPKPRIVTGLPFVFTQNGS